MKKLTLTLSLLAFLFMGNEALAQKKKKQDPAEAAETIALYKKTDEGMANWFNTAYGYAVFPSVGKGGLGVGGALGHGVVYQGGAVTGGVKLSQVSVGFQWGGQAFSEVIFFENAEAYTRFIESKAEFAAQVSAVALTAGVSADAEYRDGVAVFTQAIGGLMYQASVGGQKFKFYPPGEMK